MARALRSSTWAVGYRPAAHPRRRTCLDPGQRPRHCHPPQLAGLRSPVLGVGQTGGVHAGTAFSSSSVPQPARRAVRSAPAYDRHAFFGRPGICHPAGNRVSATSRGAAAIQATLADPGHCPRPPPCLTPPAAADRPAPSARCFSRRRWGRPQAVIRPAGAMKSSPASIAPARRYPAARADTRTSGAAPAGGSHSTSAAGTGPAAGPGQRPAGRRVQHGLAPLEGFHSVFARMVCRAQVAQRWR